MRSYFSGTACRVVTLQKAELALPASETKLTDCLPLTTQNELWSLDTPSTDQGESMLRDAVAQHRGVYVVECGYNGSGRDPLAWYIGGTTGTNGVLTMLLGRLCSAGGTADVSLAALDITTENNSALDLFAPFVSVSKANALTAATITSVDDFRDLVRKAFASPTASFIKRSASSYAVVISSAGVRHAFVLLAEEHHAEGLQYFTTEKSSSQQHGDATSSSSSSPASLPARTVLEYVCRVMSARRKSDGTTVRWLPFLVVRIGADQRQDPLQVLSSIFRPNTPALSAAVEPLAQRTVPPLSKDQPSARKATPPQQQQPPPAKPRLTAAEAEKIAQDTADLTKDISRVDAATRQVLDQHKMLREALRLRRLEFESAIEAKNAAQSRANQLREIAESTKREIKQLEDELTQQAEAERKAEIARTQSKKSSVELARNQSRTIEMIKERTKNAVEAIQAEAALKQQEAESTFASVELELRSVLDTTRRNIALAEEEKRAFERQILEEEQQRAAKEESFKQLEKQRASLEQQGNLIRQEIAAKAEAEKRLEVCRREHDNIVAEVNALREVVERQSNRFHALTSQLTSEESNATILRQLDARTSMALRDGSRRLLDAEYDVARSEIELAESRLRTDLVKVELRRRQALQTSLPADDIRDLVSRVLNELRRSQSTKRNLLQEKEKLEVECTLLADRLQQSMSLQEGELGHLRAECSAALERVEQLRRRQRVHFAEKEARLNADKGTFNRLFDEFLVQMDDESIAAAMRTTMSSSISPRSSSPPPTNPSSLAMVPSTSSNSSNRPLTLEDKGEICALYLAWADQCHKVREAELEATRARANLDAVTHRISLSADELSSIRQKIAAMDERMRFMQEKEVEADAALEDFISSSLKQRQELERVIEGYHVAAQEQHALAVMEVSTQTAAVEASQRDLVELQVVLRSLAAELEEAKMSTVTSLTEQLSILRSENVGLESRVAGMHRAKANLGHTPDASFISAAEQANSGYSTPGGSTDRVPTATTTKFHF